MSLAPTPAPVPLERFEPIPDGSAQFAPAFCEANKVLKLAETDEAITVGFALAPRQDVLASIASLSGKRVESVCIDAAEFASFLGKRLGREAGATGVAGPGAGDERILIDRLANDAPVVNLVNAILIDAIRAEASDIHIEAFGDGAVVRYRVDGALVVVQRFARERFAAVSARIKIMANLNVMEKRLPQDGRLTVDLAGAPIDMRVSIVPIARGESIVLRVFGTTSAPLSLDALGMGSALLGDVERLLKTPHGLILVTGPTGSGKSTTLSAMLRALRSEACKVISIEDPIEYVVDGVNQIQTNERIQLSFESLLRRVLRQDPDVVMVGEVRDHATADLVVRAAMTGHLVLTTLHTNDSVSAVTRLKNIGVEPYLVASVLRGAFAQRLVRRLCPACAGTRDLGPAERAIAQRWGVAIKRAPLAVGCPACRGSGFSGRFAVFEYFACEPELEELVAGGARGAAISAWLGERGMVRLASAALETVAQGLTSFEEVEREVGL